MLSHLIESDGYSKVECTCLGHAYLIYGDPQVVGGEEGGVQESIPDLRCVSGTENQTY